MKKVEFWFVVGSQLLYGPEVLATVEARAKEMAEALSRLLPYPIVYKVTAKSAEEVSAIVKEANYRDECAGIISSFILRRRNHTAHAGQKAVYFMERDSSCPHI